MSKVRHTEYWAIQCGTKQDKVWEAGRGWFYEEAPFYWPNKSNWSPMRFKTKEAAETYLDETLDGAGEVKLIRYDTLVGL